MASKWRILDMRIKKMGQVFTGVGLLVEYLFCDGAPETYKERFCPPGTPEVVPSPHIIIIFITGLFWCVLFKKRVMLTLYHAIRMLSKNAI